MKEILEKFNKSYEQLLVQPLRGVGFFDGSAGKEKLYFRHHRQRFFEAIMQTAPYLASGVKVLDVGVSPFTLLLKKIFPEIDLVALDLTERFEPRCVRTGITFIKWDIGKFPLPFKDNSFSVIFFNEVLEHVWADHRLIFKELERLLSKKGVLLVQTPNNFSLDRRLRFLAGLAINSSPSVFIDHQAQGDCHFYEYSLPELKNLLKTSSPLKILWSGYSGYYDNLKSLIVYRKNLFEKIIYFLPLNIYCLITLFFPSLRRGIEIVLKKK